MKPYPAYKDSGVEWLGEVPEGWDVVPLKRRFSVRLGKMLQPASRATEDFEASYLRAANIQWSGVDLSDVKTMWFNEVEAEALTLKRGDLLVSEGGDVGRSAIIEADLGEVYFQNSVNRVRARARDCTRFLYYWMSVIKARGYVDVLCNKSTIAHFTAEKVASVPVPLPSPPEQQTIVAFLDRETAKIDGLIEEQRRLIALLAEKRQATISHAVTRGLNPSARLKPSGVDWLGDIPEGWEVVRLRHLVALNPSKSEVADRARTEEVSFLPMEAVGENGELDLSRTRPINEVETGYTYFQDGDVTYAKITPCFENGKGALMRGLVGEIGFGTTELTVLRPIGQRLLPEFLYRLTASSFFRLIGEGSMYGAGGQKRVPDDFARNFPVALPPMDEQAEILAHIDGQTTQLDALTETATSAITLLQERRAALISAAVTGKIDVRGLASAEDAA